MRFAEAAFSQGSSGREKKKPQAKQAYHPRLVDLACSYIRFSFVPTPSLKKGTLRPWVTRDVRTSCTLPRARKLHPEVSFVVARVIAFPFFIFGVGSLVLRLRSMYEEDSIPFFACQPISTGWR